MKQKRILVLTSSFPRSAHDWWAQFILSLHKNIPHVWGSTILGPDAPYAKQKEMIGTIPVIRYSYFYPRRFQVLTTGSGILHSSKTNLFARMQVPLLVISEFAYAFFYMLKGNYKLFHAHWLIPQGVVGVCMKKLFSIPLVVTVHGSDVFGLKKFTFLKKFVLKHADVCTVNSTYTQKAVRKLDKTIQIQIIPMGIDKTTFSPSKKSKKIKEMLNPEGPILICVGRLIRVKGFSYAIQAMPYILKKFPKIKLVIVGNGPLQNELTALIQKFNIEKNVTILSSISHAKLSELYATSDICLVPSVTDPQAGETESQGVVVLEAMASGIPVVGSRSGGIVDVVIHKRNGLLVTPAKPNEISSAVISLLSDDDYRKKMGILARKMVIKQYNWTTIGNLFSKVYSEVLSLYDI